MGSPGCAADRFRFVLSGRWRFAAVPWSQPRGWSQEPGSWCCISFPVTHCLRLRCSICAQLWPPQAALSVAWRSPCRWDDFAPEPRSLHWGSLTGVRHKTYREPLPVTGTSSATRAAKHTGCFVLPVLSPDQSCSLFVSPGVGLRAVSSSVGYAARGIHAWQRLPSTVLPFGWRSPRRSNLSPTLEGAPCHAPEHRAPSSSTEAVGA